jgi:hypothetical protein
MRNKGGREDSKRLGLAPTVVIYFLFSLKLALVTQSGLNNEQFKEPHAFLMANDLAPRPPPPPSVRRDIGRLRKRETT